MPHSDLHKKKQKKNMAVLAAIFGFCAVIAMITVIKITGNWG